MLAVRPPYHRLSIFSGWDSEFSTCDLVGGGLHPKDIGIPVAAVRLPEKSLFLPATAGPLGREPKRR